MLGFPREVAQALLDPGLRGLVLICGDMGTGKTSKAASLIVERLTRHGGIAFVKQTLGDLAPTEPHWDEYLRAWV